MRRLEEHFLLPSKRFRCFYRTVRLPRIQNGPFYTTFRDLSKMEKCFSSWVVLGPDVPRSSRRLPRTLKGTKMYLGKSPTAVNLPKKSRRNIVGRLYTIKVVLPSGI